MEGLFVLFFIIFAIVIISMILLSIKNKAFKETVVIKVLDEVLDDVMYGYSKGFDRNLILDTKLINKGSSFSSSDFVDAKYDGIPFQMGNVNIEYTYTIDDQTYTDVYFKGQWLIFDIEKSIDGKLYMIDRDFKYSTPHKPGLFSKTDLNKVETESIGFNKQFKVYASNPLEVFEVLSPQKILEFYDKHREDVSFYLSGTKLHVAIYSNKEIFSVKLLKSESQDQQEIRVRNEILEVLSYLNILKGQ